MFVCQSSVVFPCCGAVGFAVLGLSVGVERSNFL